MRQRRMQLGKGMGVHLLDQMEITKFKIKKTNKSQILNFNYQIWIKKTKKISSQNMNSQN